MTGDTFLLFVGVCENKDVLTDKKLLSGVLKDLPGLIQMQGIREPVITTANNNPGLEAYLPIDTSNITLSTYTNTSRIVGCIHSCKKFDPEVVVRYMQEKYSFIKLSYRQIEENEIDRIFKLCLSTI